MRNPYSLVNFLPIMTWHLLEVMFWCFSKVKSNLGGKNPSVSEVKNYPANHLEATQYFIHFPPSLASPLFFKTVQLPSLTFPPGGASFRRLRQKRDDSFQFFASPSNKSVNLTSKTKKPLTILFPIFLLAFMQICVFVGSKRVWVVGENVNHLGFSIGGFCRGLSHRCSSPFPPKPISPCAEIKKTKPLTEATLSRATNETLPFSFNTQTPRLCHHRQKEGGGKCVFTLLTHKHTHYCFI